MKIIKFKHLKRIHDDEDYLLKYLNDFEGKNVFEKFRNILISWERDVSYNISLQTDDKNAKIQLQYIIDQLNEEYDNEIFYISSDNMLLECDVPSQFSKNHNIFSIENFIKKIKFLNTTINYEELTESEKIDIITNLPINLFSKFKKDVTSRTNKTINFNNSILKNMSINFLTNAPYDMLKGLFSPFQKDYFRDVVYHLSKKIDGNILINSTIQDIDYYIDKMNEDNKSNSVPEL
jgi:hypothetical protein